MELAQETIKTPSQALLEDFRLFTEASNRLQAKYDVLAREVQGLRKQLAIKEDEIKRSEGLVMLGKAAASIAHEVRNPLGAIKIFISLLKEDLKNQPESLELVEQIEKSSNALDNVVTNILHFAKQSKLPLVPVDLRLIINEQLAEIALSHPSNVEIDTQFEGNLIVSGHEASLKQVVNNLVVNALQANPKKVLIRGFNSSEGSVVLEISDDGVGIPESLLDTLFDPFVTMKNEGTGLGLAIVKRIVLQHGAEISVANNGGAVFTIIFSKQKKAV